MSKLKIVIQEELFISSVTTSLVLPLFLDCGGVYFPCNHWTDFVDILNMWSYTLIRHVDEKEAEFILYFMDGPYRLDVIKDREMKLTIQCVNFRGTELVELTVQCEYIELLEAVYKAVNKFSKILYERNMHKNRFEATYNQSLLTSKELKAVINQIR